MTKFNLILELITPAGLVKSIKLDVLYFRDNTSPAVAQRVLMVELEVAEVVVQNAQRLNSRGVAIAPADPAQVPAAQKTVSAEREIESLERGAKLVRNGDIAAARLLYEDLALSGSAKGARAGRNLRSCIPQGRLHRRTSAQAGEGEDMVRARRRIGRHRVENPPQRSGPALTAKSVIRYRRKPRSAVSSRTAGS